MLAATSIGGRPLKTSWILRSYCRSAKVLRSLRRRLENCAASWRTWPGNIATLRRDARGLNGVPRRRVVPRRSQPQRAIAASERNYRLHRSFAERSRADEGGALLVLQGAGDDFRGRCRAAVDSDDQRLALD